MWIGFSNLEMSIEQKMYRVGLLKREWKLL